MKEIRDKIEKIRQELDDLVVEICAKSKLNDHFPNFGKKEKLDKSALWTEQANGKLFYALTALGN